MAWSDAARAAAAEIRRARAAGKRWRRPYGKFTVWGLPKGQTDRLHEKILSTQSNGPEHVRRVKEAAARDGWHSFRVVRGDGKPPDFSGAVKKGRR